ncbi:MAG: hypothetical protein OEL58_04730 [Desulfobacteraceae bacterium]|nr:hypothetical protein [Desulfobacteraceae bacterium]
MTLFEDKTTRRAKEEHQLDIDFDSAMYTAFKEELKGFLFRKAHRLLPFELVKDKLEIWFAKNMGIQAVPIENIVGSEGRYRSFTRHFLPLQEDLRDRWKKVNQARYSKKDLPPVELYKVGNAYFVKDGHHRVSVARTKGSRYIEAQIYEYECDVPLEKDTDLDKLAIQETYHQFLKETQLRKNRPHSDFQLTLLGGYNILMEHIQAHKYYLEKTNAVEIPISEAACSWYDRLYEPFVSAIRKNGIIKRFRHRTETDFYLWVIKNRRKLIEEFAEDKEAEDLVEAYAWKYSGPFRKIIGAFKRFFGLVRY